LINAVYAFMVPYMTFPTQAAVGFPETLPGELLGLDAQCFLHLSIITHGYVIITGLAQSHCAARPADAFAQIHQFLSKLSALAGLQSFFITSFAASRSN